MANAIRAALAGEIYASTLAWVGAPERILRRCVKNIETSVEAELIEEKIETASSIKGNFNVTSW